MKISIFLRTFLLVLMVFFVVAKVESEPIYSFATVKQKTQFHNLLKELRCLVCQNQDLADSNAALASDLREQIYNLVKGGGSDVEILNYLTSRYGDFILFKPAVKSQTAFLWFGPALFLILGLVIFFAHVRYGSSQVIQEQVK